MIKQSLLIVGFFLSLFFVSGVLAADINSDDSVLIADSCDCPEVTCDSCQELFDIKFYSEKCEGGKKVKSCKRPICKDKDPLPKVCESTKKNNQENISKGKKNEKEEDEFTEVKAVAIITKNKKKGKKVGSIVFAKGLSWIYRGNNSRVEVKRGKKVLEGDVFETEASGKVKILFKNKNELNVTPNSKIKIAKIDDTNGAEKSFLDLAYGQVRSIVNKKYVGKNRYFRVRTKSAVAGVRGTDFIVSYDEKDGFQTKVATIGGKVAFAQRLDANDDGQMLDPDEDSKNAIEVKKGTYAKFVIDDEKITSDVFTHSDIKEFVSRGYMTPVYKLTAKDLKILEKETGFGEDSVPTRALASQKNKHNEGESLCSAPKASFNQCMWGCSKDVSGKRTCVRKRCNANGKWAEEKRLPASFRPKSYYKTEIRECDY